MESIATYIVTKIVGKYSIATGIATIATTIGGVSVGLL